MSIRVLTSVLFIITGFIYTSYHQYELVSREASSLSSLVKHHIEGSLIAPTAERMALLSEDIIFQTPDAAPSLSSTHFREHFDTLSIANADFTLINPLYLQKTESDTEELQQVLHQHRDEIGNRDYYLLATNARLVFIYAMPSESVNSEALWLVATLDETLLQRTLQRLELSSWSIASLRHKQSGALLASNLITDAQASPTAVKDDIATNIRQGETSGVSIQKSSITSEYGLYTYNVIPSTNIIAVAGIPAFEAFSSLIDSLILLFAASVIVVFTIRFLHGRLQNSVASINQLQDSLTDSEKQAKLIFALSEQAVIVVDKHFTCKFVSDSALKLFAVDDADTLLHENMQDVALGLPAAKMESLIRKALSKQEASAVIDEFHNKQGERFPLQIDAFPNVKNNQLIGCVILFKDITEKVRSQQQIKYMAYHDSLTGMANRWSFKKTLDTYVLESRDAIDNLYVVVIGLDNFKSINDSYGHRFGDEVLTAIAERLNTLSKPNIMNVARLGSDEFIALITASDTSSLNKELQSLIKMISRPVVKSEFSLSLSASLGVACYPQDGESFDTLLTAATMAMYEAKKTGRNAFAYYYEELGAHAKKALIMQTELSEAIKKGQLELHYQPKHALRTGAVAGLEALVRWRHPEKGMISPGEFIPIAENTGLIIPLSRWVFKEAFAFSVRLQNLGLTTKIAVNSSALHFKKGFLEDVSGILELTNAEASLLEIELTESLLFENTDNITDILNRLKELGFTLSIDDFGTGFSNLSYLYQLEVDTIKIDRSFITNIDHEEHKQTLVDSLVKLAANMSLTTIAEGVETQAELDFLTSINCEQVQGYYYSAPKPEAMITAYLADNTAKTQQPASIASATMLNMS